MLYHTTQGHLLRREAQLCVLGPPTPITNGENALQTRRLASLMEVFFTDPPIGQSDEGVFLG